MTLTDPIGDMFSRIRNGQLRLLSSINVPASNFRLQILEVLNNCGSCTLTGLSAKLGLSKTAVQRDHELYLLNKNLIEIDGKRKITNEGMKLCESF